MSQLNNQIVKKQKQEQIASYEVNGAEIKLSASTVRNYLTNGNGNVTDQEVAYFINLCKYQKLNPLIKECYLIKYGSSPATIVTSKDALLKRAMRNERYRGHEAGVIVRSNTTGELNYRTGAIILQDEHLIGGWAKVYIEGYKVPIEAAVSFNEYAGMKDGKLNSMWGGKPGTMIRKVALVAAMREAFPEDLGGMYASEEVGADVDETAMTPVDIEQEPQQAQATEYTEPTGAQASFEELEVF